MRNPTHLLNDVEIMAAIKSGLIRMNNPEQYLNDQFIQPASQDVLIEGVDSERFLSSKVPSRREEGFYYEHPQFEKDFVAFWPGSVTDALIRDFKGFNPKYLAPMVELRSTLRRLGLCVEHSGVPFGYDGFTVGVFNSRNFPVIVEKGTKLAQLLWTDFFMVPARYGYVPHNKNISSGIEVTDAKTLEKLLETGDLQVTPEPKFCDGKLFFHAGTTQTRYQNDAEEPIVLYKDKKTVGLTKTVSEAEHHTILPGDFVDIQTIESIKLSKRIGMHIFYYATWGDEYEEQAALPKSISDRALTFSNTGGWIDPGYSGIFSVQRHAYTEPLEIRRGQRVAQATIYFFPDGVGNEYGSHRGSHYQHQDRFLSAQANKQ